MYSNLPTSATVRRSILRFAQSMVPFSTLKALQIILSECCQPVVKSVTAVCNPNYAGGFIVTIVLESPLNFANQATIELGGVTHQFSVMGDLHQYVDDTTILTLDVNPGAITTDAVLVFNMLTQVNAVANSKAALANSDTASYFAVSSPAIQVLTYIPQIIFPTC